MASAQITLTELDFVIGTTRCPTCQAEVGQFCRNLRYLDVEQGFGDPHPVRVRRDGTVTQQKVRRAPWYRHYVHSRRRRTMRYHYSSLAAPTLHRPTDSSQDSHGQEA